MGCRADVGRLPGDTQTLHGPDVEEPAPRNPFPLLSWSAGVTGPGNPHEGIFCLQAARQLTAVDEKYPGVCRRQKQSPCQQGRLQHGPARQGSQGGGEVLHSLQKSFPNNS